MCQSGIPLGQKSGVSPDRQQVTAHLLFLIKQRTKKIFPIFRKILENFALQIPENISEPQNKPQNYQTQYVQTDSTQKHENSVR